MKILITLADKLVEAETKVEWSEFQLFALASETAYDKNQDWQKVEIFKNGKVLNVVINPKYDSKLSPRA